MPIYEVQCRYCNVIHLIDSRKHLYKRFEENGHGTDVFVQCQCCHQLFRTEPHELVEIQEPYRYNNPVREESRED